MISREQFAARATPNPTEQHLTLVVFTTFVLLSVFAFQFERLIFPRSGTQFLLLPGALLLVLVHEWMHAAFGILDGDMLAYIDVSKPSRSRGFGGGVTWSIPKRTFFKIFKASMGYLGSSAVFSLMIFSSFNILASKIICFALLPVLLTSVIWLDPRNKTGYWLIAAAVITTVPFWFVDHGRGLRFWIMWLGTSGILFDLQDTWNSMVFVDHGRGLRFWIMWLGTSGILFDLQDTWNSMVLSPASDALFFAARYGGNGKVIGRIWWGMNTAFLAAAVFGAILAFKDTRVQQIQQASRFLPT